MTEDTILWDPKEGEKKPEVASKLVRLLCDKLSQPDIAFVFAEMRRAALLEENDVRLMLSKMCDIDLITTLKSVLRSNRRVGDVDVFFEMAIERLETKIGRRNGKNEETAGVVSKR